MKGQILVSGLLYVSACLLKNNAYGMLLLNKELCAHLRPDTSSQALEVG